MKFIGKGDAYDITHGVMFYDQADIQVNVGMETISFPAGNAFSNIIIPVGQPITGSISFRDMRSGHLVALMAASTATGAVKYAIQENIVIAGSSGVLASTPYNLNGIFVIDSAG